MCVSPTAAGLQVDGGMYVVCLRLPIFGGCRPLTDPYGKIKRKKKLEEAPGISGFFFEYFYEQEMGGSSKPLP